MESYIFPMHTLQKIKYNDVMKSLVEDYTREVKLIQY